MELEMKITLANHRIFMANESYESALCNFKNKRYNRSVDDIYYACFNLTRACLILIKEEDFSDHGKCIGEFNKFFVNELGDISRVTGSALHTLARERNKKTYKETIPVSEEEANEILDLGKNVYDEIKLYYDLKLNQINNIN